MNCNISVSKGVFVFKNNLQILKDKKGSSTIKNVNCNIYFQPWFQAYANLWKNIEKKIDVLNKEMFSSILTNLIHFIKICCSNDVCEIPTAALLTGINMPDHLVQFTTLIKTLKQDVSPHVACLYSQDCHNLKSLNENMMHQFINNTTSSLQDESEYELESKYRTKKRQFNFSILQAWYEKEYGIYNRHKSEKQLRKFQRKVLVVIIPDLESFNDKLLQEFILICSSYINILPFVFVFGIATSLSVLHKMLPYHVSSKVNIQYFNSQSSTIYLNNVLDNVFLTDGSPFHLGGRVFNLLMDVFLFYDFSVTNFIQKYKYSMLEHFSYGNIMTLCNNKRPSDIIAKFDHNDCENARRLLSFRSLVESESNINKIKLLTDDNYFKIVLHRSICNIQQYLNTFHLFLRCLNVLIGDLPKNPLGKQIRELYSKAVTSDITQCNSYKTCIQLLQFQSKAELSEKMSQITELIKNECKPFNMNSEELKQNLETIYFHLEEMENTDTDTNETDAIIEEIGNVSISNTKDRNQFRETLLKRTQLKKATSRYETAKIKLVKFMDTLFEKYLYCPNKLYFHEIFFFNDTCIENHVIGFHRAAIHTALNDPHQYLQCQCCKKQNESVILKTMPDICIAYKLHLEYGKMINLYDWMQAFLSIINPICKDEEEENEIDPIVQARFTLAVAELEFLGFIKSSKRKADHVQRLTWGG